MDEEELLEKAEAFAKAHGFDPDFGRSEADSWRRSVARSIDGD
jgi:hypothetical protein